MNRTGSDVEQADKALTEPFKHTDALKAAQTDSARIDQIMADAAKPEEPAQPDPRPKSTSAWRTSCTRSERTGGYDAARTARLKRLLDGGLRQRSAHLGSEPLEEVPMDFMSATQEWVIKRGGAF